MLNTKEILDAVTAPATEWTKGRLVAHHRALTGGNRQGYDPEQTALVEHPLERPSTVTEAYPHPTATPKGNGKLHGDTGERKPLEQADLIWL